VLGQRPKRNLDQRGDLDADGEQIGQHAVRVFQRAGIGASRGGEQVLHSGTDSLLARLKLAE